MSNPTLGHQSQFITPYNIIPDVIYTNPTSNASQFAAPYDILPNTTYANPTTGATQFNTPLNFGENSTYNILPDTIYTTNPTTGTTQFNTPLNFGEDSTYNILPDTNYTPKNPTVGTTQFNTYLIETPEGGVTTYDILPNTDYKPKNDTLTQQATNQFPEPSVASIYPDYAEAATNYTQYISSSYIGQATNIDEKSFAQSLLGFGVTTLGSTIGIPQVSQLSSTVTSIAFSDSIQSKYATLNKDQLNNKVFGIPVPYPDFRARRVLSGITGNQQQINALGQIRADGASALLRGSAKAGLYLAAAASPAGAYSIFNLDGYGKTGYGLGSQGEPYALRNDFTLRSNVATQWKPLTEKDAIDKTSRMGKYGKWVPSRTPQDIAIPFRGDRVNVIDFKQSSLKSVYQWKRDLAGDNIYQTATTQDFIKFYLTGPKLHAGVRTNMQTKDDVLVFRAIISSISDTFSPTWTPQQMIGRADSNYHYSEFGRDLDLDFVVYASDRDEMQSMWRKLNALAGYTAPSYNPNDITLNGPWMRITVGDLFYQQPVLLNSLRYTIHDSDTTWEINIEDDPTMMQAPHRITVSCGFHVITDYLPQKNGRFYTLAKEFDDTGLPHEGKDNWLSDFLGNSKQSKEERDAIRKQIENFKKTDPAGDTAGEVTTPGNLG